MVLILAANTYGQTIIKTDSCTVCFRVHYIPCNVIRRVNRKYKFHLYLANPNKPYRSTDVVTHWWLSSRRLKFFIKTDSMYILCYEQGGLGYHPVFIFIEPKRRGYIKNIDVHVNWLTFNYQDVINAIKKRIYEVLSNTYDL